MSDYNTGNPVPSNDPRDLDDNATILDRLVSGPALTYPDRLGVARKSYAGMEADIAAFSSPNVIALSGLTGSADRLPYFTGAGALSLTTLTAAARTVLDDTTVGAMLTTMGGAPLASPAFTGVPTAPTAAIGTNTTQLATMGALQARILGTVSQAAGVPTGAILETATNANGTYIKYADGTMICTKSVSIASAAITTGTGSLFFYSAASQSFAATFSAVPVVHIGAYAGGALFWATNGNTSTTATSAFSVMSATSQTVALTLSISAIGRWF